MTSHLDGNKSGDKKKLDSGEKMVNVARTLNMNHSTVDTIYTTKAILWNM